MAAALSRDPRAWVLALAVLLPMVTALEKPGVLSGKIMSPGLANTVVRLHTADGREVKSFVQTDGTFEFHNVPAGSHLLQAFQLGYFYPEIKVETSAKSGLLRATLVGQQKPVAFSLPLVIKPLGELAYYEKRKPVDVMSLIKSPYGLMIAFSLFIIVVMPKMKVDPEELKQMQASLRGEAAQGSGGQQQQQRIAGRS